LFRLWFALLAVAALVLGAGLARAEDQRARADIWSLKLGTPASALPHDAFDDYACGSNGGPPQQLLAGWADYDKCRSEPNGLREVYFRYDDELEYRAKAHRAQTMIAQYAGTKVFDFPVIVSALFDADGVLAGLRIVSDPRDTSRDRDEAYLLRNFLTARYGRDGWDCVDLPLAEGETPVARTFIKQRCRKTIEGTAVAEIETHFFRKKGQNQFDPQSGRTTEGQFESLARFELTLAK